MLPRFVDCQRGSVAPIFAITLLPMLAATGAAVDYSQAYRDRTVIQSALDAAALAANRKIGVLPDADIKKEAEAFYLANIGSKIDNPPPFAMSLGGGEVALNVDLHVPTTFLGVVGFNEIVFDITSRTVAGAATYEVVMVLDNSGSMRGSKFSSLKDAAMNFVKILYEVNASNPKPDPVKIGLVPFAGSVNVGPKYASASWMDRNGLSPIHYEDFEGNSKTRWDLFDAMTGVSWGGCPMARPYPYDVNDVAPMTGKPETLFVPLFAPDEPDKGSFDNDYIADDKGDCPGTTPATDNSTPSQEAAQARLCKYAGEKPGGGAAGPNGTCTTAPILPLTSSRSTIESGINAMDIGKNTNIHSGVIWGWRVLSPGEPFTEGRAYGEPGNHKFLLVMTDGSNNYETKTNFNKSIYSAYGYVSQGHLGTTSSSQSQVDGKLDDRTLEACNGAKAAGITVYTVAFQVTDKKTLALMKDCASEPSKALTAGSNSELVANFKAIGEQISLLRIAE